MNNIFWLLAIFSHYFIKKLNSKKNGKVNEYYFFDLIFQGKYINDKEIVKEKNIIKIEH